MGDTIVEPSTVEPPDSWAPDIWAPVFEPNGAQVFLAQMSGAQLSGGSTVGAHLSRAQLSVYRSQCTIHENKSIHGINYFSRKEHRKLLLWPVVSWFARDTVNTKSYLFDNLNKINICCWCAYLVPYFELKCRFKLKFSQYHMVESTYITSFCFILFCFFCFV
jgi:hypothetical protein